MAKWVLFAGRYLVLVMITLAATAVMWWVARPNDAGALHGGGVEVASPPRIAAAKAVVRAMPTTPEWCDVTIRYSGKVRAWETFSLGFEIGGRVAELGVTPSDTPLDDSDRVTRGQLLARLDDRSLRAQYSEAVAQYELASSDLERSRRVREQSIGALSEAEYQNDLTQVALRRAAQEIASKNLEDAVLTSPIDGVIDRRLVEVGESVNPHTTIFEVVQNDHIRLVLSVPEARVRELELRRRAVAAAQNDPTASSEDQRFIAHVTLEGNDVRGRPWPPIEAEVYRIAETADLVTGLFEIEVRIPNEDGLLRPGMVATARLVTDRLLAYRVPESAVLFRAGKSFLFAIESVPAEMQVLFWSTGEGQVESARRVEVHDWIDQGETLLLPADSYDFTRVITRGQQRLRDNEPIRVLSEDTDEKLGVVAPGVASKR